MPPYTGFGPYRIVDTYDLKDWAALTNCRTEVLAFATGRSGSMSSQKFLSRLFRQTVEAQGSLWPTALLGGDWCDAGYMGSSCDGVVALGADACGRIVAGGCTSVR